MATPWTGWSGRRTHCSGRRTPWSARRTRCARLRTPCASCRTSCARRRTRCAIRRTHCSSRGTRFPKRQTHCAELATGFTLRVTLAEDLAAFPLVAAACRKHARVLAERMLSSSLVAGIEPVAKQLDDIFSLSIASEEMEGPASPDEIVVAAAAKFAGARRKAIARIAKGEKNRALRRAFGISEPMKTTSLDEVRAACLSLLAGRAGHPGSQAARMITPADVKKAKELVAQMGEIKSRHGARKSSAAEVARTRDVLHAALELFYDRFGAAVDLAFEDDDATRVALLSLIPRRKDRRAAAAKNPIAPPAPALPRAAG